MKPGPTAKAGRAPQKRRSLTHVGGEASLAGDPELSAILSRALSVAPSPEPRGRGSAAPAGDDPDRSHVHGFHSYPARMHPETAAGLVRAVSSAGETVLDPFCGSGTVLVEAMMAGRRAIGTDLNPLAVDLAKLKTSPFSAAAAAKLVSTAHRVSATADERRASRAGATHRYPPEDVEAFEPHVLLELDSLRAAIIAETAGDAPFREALKLVFSAILVKVSRRTSDTSEALAPRRIAAGFTARIFSRKAEELARRMAEMTARLPPGALPARVTRDDATRLPSVGASTIDAVVTSPPYVGTYDYLAHHALRMRWLELDASAFAAGEMGSRRRYGRLDAASALRAWSSELLRAMQAMARVCRPGGRVALLLADSAVMEEAIRADTVVGALAPQAGLVVLARASQVRPHFHGPTIRAFRDAPRAEHAIVLEKRAPSPSPSGGAPSPAGRAAP